MKAIIVLLSLVLGLSAIQQNTFRSQLRGSGGGDSGTGVLVQEFRVR